jgi:bifunctional UDP-N-acetylglucosamine pyrophosphorylase/glucosamine-1-phosphate N-acetyltransferase
LSARAATIAVVLAAGRGTRMKSRRPKVLHEVGGRPLLEWVLRAAREAGCERTLVIVGHGAEGVRQRFASADVEWIAQEQQLGTGHALAQVATRVAGEARLLVLSGDVPMVRPETLRTLVAASRGCWGSMAVADLEQPGALGRVIARHDETLERIVEAADAAAEPSLVAVRTVNAGIYVLPAPAIFTRLARLRPVNAKGEYYLTDALGDAVAGGETIRLLRLADSNEALGVNDRTDLATVHRLLNQRKVGELLGAGVTVVDPSRTTIEAAVAVGLDCVIEADAALLGATQLGEGCFVGQGAWLRDCVLGAGVRIEPYSVLDGAEIGDGCRVGPFARLRPGAVLEQGARVGNFVEVKKSRLGRGAKANHLAYLGDATVGAGANIGAGVITCNYDGERKHPTEIGDRAFVGSDTMLVAPVTVGADAVVAAGSVITKNVPEGALAVARQRQRNIEGWSARGKKSRKQQE